MKKLFLFFALLLLSTVIYAQQNGDMGRYLNESAVPLIDGKVVFKESINILPGYTDDQVGDIARKWLQERLDTYGDKKNRIVLDKDNQITAVGCIEVIFTNNSISLDRAFMNCAIVIKYESDECVLSVERIKYDYIEAGVKQIILAEDYITYENAVNRKRGRLLPITGKFRKGTIDAVDNLFASFNSAFKFYTREGVADIVKKTVRIVPDTASSETVTLEGYRNIPAKNIEGNFVGMLSDEWMLITAGDKNKYNMMTASWGGIGVLYGKPVAICFINPARYTYQIMEDSETYTLTFYSETYRDALKYCGSVSGRDENKVKGSGLTPIQTSSGAMAFGEARIIIECRKLVSQSLSLDSINDREEKDKRASQPMHKMYIGEITNVWVK